MSKVKWSDILHAAADEYLSEVSNWVCSTGRSMFSCDCIIDAAFELGYEDEGHDLISDLEQNLGLNTGMHAFDEFCSGQERQGARYAWLKFAAMYYEEQGC